MLEIKEVRELGGEVREDVLVGRGAPYVRGSRGSGLLDDRVSAGVGEGMGMGMGIGAVKGVRPAVRAG